MLAYAYILTGNSVCIYYPLLLNEGSLRLRIPGIMSVTFWNQLYSWIFSGAIPYPQPRSVSAPVNPNFLASPAPTVLFNLPAAAPRQ